MKFDEFKEWVCTKYNVIGIINIDDICSSSYRTLYDNISKIRKSEFSDNDRIVLFSNTQIHLELLTHIQICTSELDISNFFILLCAPIIKLEDLETVRVKYSNEDICFAFEIVEIEVDSKITTQNPLVPLPKNFCFNPWTTIEISSTGEFRPCCVYKGLATKEDGSLYNINNDSIDDVYHSKYMNDLREQFRKAEYPEGCSVCWNVEQYQLESQRYWAQSKLGMNRHFLNLEKNDITNLLSLDLKLGNTCNLRCRICDYKASSRIATETINELKASNMDFEYILTTIKQGLWGHNLAIWDNIKEYSSKILNLDFYGGEPFLIDRQEYLIDFLIETGASKNIKLHYNTNGSVWPHNLITRWEHFKLVEIAFSIDNIQDRFELERDGALWETVEYNINKFIENKSANMSLAMFPTFNIQNIYYLPELLEWYETKSFDSIHFNVVTTPAYMNIQYMGEELSNKVISKLTPHRYKYEVNNLIAMMENCKGNKLNEFISYMKKLDNKRNLKFPNTHKIFAEMINFGES